MDSTYVNGGPSSSDPDGPNDDSEITFLVNANIYKQWRSQYVDEIELSVWNIDMVKFAISTSFVNYGSIKTAIQRGVPDIIKHYIWIKANDADKFYIDNPNFYRNSFSSTFGDNVPSEMGDYCPTFCGGILGFQADVLDSPLVIENLHHHFDGSLESEVMYDSDNEYNFWINPYKESFPSFRDSTPPALSNKSSKGLSGLYSKFIKKFKPNETLKKKENNNNNNNESFFSVREDLRENNLSESFTGSGSEKTNPETKGQDHDSSSSIYSIQIADYPRASSEYGNKDRLIDYIHLLNNENANKRKLMKSALDKIRKGSLETRPFMRNLEKTRQMSDTFIYNSKYTSFPPPPSHHSKLMQMNAEMDSSVPADNPFYKGQKTSKKKQSGLFSCFFFICRSKNSPRPRNTAYGLGNKDDNSMSNSYSQTPSQGYIQSNYNQMYNRQPEDSYDMSIKENMNESYSNDTNLSYSNKYDSSGEDELDGFKRYKSESHIDKFVNRSNLIPDLPCINTIPEHSASNSMSFTNSKMHSNASNMLEESFSIGDVKDDVASAEHLPSLNEAKEGSDKPVLKTSNSYSNLNSNRSSSSKLNSNRNSSSSLNLNRNSSSNLNSNLNTKYNSKSNSNSNSNSYSNLVDSIPAPYNQASKGLLDSSDGNESVDDYLDIVDITPPVDLNKEEFELVSRLSKGISRQLSNKSLDGPVYKLSDVTDFTVLLTHEGVTEVKRILWCLNSYFSSSVEFLPVIPSLCCLLLIYLSPNAVLCVLYRFLSMCVNTNDQECGSRFFFVNRKGFVTFVTFVLSVLVSHMKKTIEHLRNLKVDVAAWVARSVQTGFSQILPFDYIVRIYGNFLFEGEIVLCRYCVALLKCIRTKLMECTNKEDAEELLYHIGLDPSLQIDKLTKIAFSLRIKKFDKKINAVDTPTPYLMNVKIRQFYRPRLSSKSSIVTETHWEVIWANLKPIYRILDPHNLYSSNLHGNTMLGLTKRLHEHGNPSSPALLFVKTSKLHIFGVFIPNLLNSLNKGYFTPQEMLYQMNSFVFTLFPYRKFYDFTSKNPTGIKLSKDKLIVGANSPAIILDKTLSSGHTSDCESYDSPALVPGSYFTVYMVEIWTLS